MKKGVVVICFMLCIAGWAAAQEVGPGRTLYTAVKTIPLKASTGFFASTVASLNYGDQVTVLQVSGKFVEVKSDDNPSITGWTAAENFSTKRIVAGNTGSVSANEVALAGKGFNQDVENSFKTQGDLNYADVDKVEAITADETMLLRFIKDGRLSAGE